MGIYQNGTANSSSNPRNRSSSSSPPNPLAGQEEVQDLQEGREPPRQQGTQETLQVPLEEKEEDMRSTKEEKNLARRSPEGGRPPRSAPRRPPGEGGRGPRGRGRRRSLVGDAGRPRRRRSRRRGALPGGEG